MLVRSTKIFQKKSEFLIQRAKLFQNYPTYSNFLAITFEIDNLKF